MCEGVRQLAQLRLPHKALDSGQVGVVQEGNPGLQQDNRRQPAFEDGHRPQFSAERGNVIVRQVAVAAQHVADGPPHGTHRGAVVLKTVAEPGLCFFCPKPGALALQRGIHEVTGISHPTILPFPPVEDRTPEGVSVRATAGNRCGR